jgi:predicted nuclease of restriction endonuclease-like (RecB) superfamily
MTRRFGWTKNVLIHQIENQTFEKTVVSQQNFEETLPDHLQEQAILAVKDDYALVFWNSAINIRSTNSNNLSSKISDSF